jgi:DNA (cytosine-5)-methyltransferase 1
MGEGRKPTREKAKPSFLAVDFFCGAGGTTRGLMDAGGYVIAGIDKDPRCRTTFAENNINACVDYCPPRYLCHDIFPRTEAYTAGGQKALTAELDRLLAYYTRRSPRTPLLFAICAPCQPFTRLSRKELSDRRKAGRERDSNLLKEAAKFVARHRPELVLSENVAGIKDPKYGGVWDAFRDDLEALGYVTGSKLVCTSNFGIAQFRKRSILLAVRRELVKEERLADIMGHEMLVPESDPDAPYMTVREVLKDLPPIGAGEAHPEVPNHRTRALTEINYRRLQSAKPGESNAYMLDTEFGDLSLECHRKVNERLNDRCFGDVYTRMRPNRPSPTITTKCHSVSNGRFGHYDVSQVRAISLREAALLQSFPMDYVFHPGDEIEPVARMIGNAVPPKLAQFFAGYLAASLRPRP